jgi:hypothetical protein
MCVPNSHQTEYGDTEVKENMDYFGTCMKGRDEKEGKLKWWAGCDAEDSEYYKVMAHYSFGEEWCDQF